MKSIALEAETFRILLMNDCINSQEIIAWADQKIMDEDKPSIDLIELSIAGPDKIADVAARLAILSAGGDLLEALRAALGTMYDVAVKTQPGDLSWLAACLAKIAAEHNNNLPADLKFLVRLDEEFSRAADGTDGDLPTVTEKLVNNLKHFKDRSPT